MKAIGGGKIWSSWRQWLARVRIVVVQLAVLERREIPKKKKGKEKGFL